MPSYRQKLQEVEAYRWFKNGDHPKDNSIPMEGGELTEGKVVRRFRTPEISENSLIQPKCQKCSNDMHDHGWIDNALYGDPVCPGDYVITGVDGTIYPMKPDEFERVFELIGYKDGENLGG